ncbi:MAG: flagella basal body P-ring formation protein FlgA [Maricaulis sp.]|jgi:flagella basal body P-ring formation protein FlgA|nr:flagella basal body P-ring formation protein FlgA [Maricaulis sp.]HAQ34463.1 flagella basal body P-ring formation protein FlgA [Alphaproteobacteria bacterium]
MHIKAALLVAALIAAPAFADETVILRDAITVDGDMVTLGDLFGIEGEGADTPVTRAPQPGQRGSIDPGYVQDMAARHGYEWANASRVRRIAVTRQSRVIGMDLITELVAAELYARTGDDYEVQFSGTQTFHAPPGATGLPEVASLQHNSAGGLFTADIVTHAGGEPVRVTGRAYATTLIPVLAHPVAAGTTITPADIDWQPVRSDRIRADAVLNADAMEGMAARRALRPGEAIRAYDLQAPVIVARGEIVQLVFTVPGMTLTARARALENAGADEVARFVNLQSNRTVEAMVEGPGRARVVGGAAS